MRNVMVRCLFSILILVLSHEFRIINAQERHPLQWSDQQLFSDDWQPFVPNFAQERPYHQYPRTDTIRQFFGKNVEAVHNSLKKSFQTSAANNVDQYVVPPALSTFNTFGLQMRPAILDKNVKDSQFLEQSSHFPLVKYQHQLVQQQPQQQTHRFPSYIPAPAPQYQTTNQFPTYQSAQNQFSNRYESSAKQPPLLPAPARTISTSVQLFPPNANQQNRYSANGFFVPAAKNENFVENEPPVSRKQSRPNDFLVTNNIATIYGTKDPALNIAPPSLKTAPFVRPEIQNHFLYEPAKAAVPEQFEIVTNNYPKQQGQYEVVLPPAKQQHHEHKHADEPLGAAKQPQIYDQLNPSKQVFEQLSHYGRPFTLPKESVTEFNSRLQPEKQQHAAEPEGLIQSYSPPASQHHYHYLHHHKKEKAKQPHHHYMPLKNTGRYPANSVPPADTNNPATLENQLLEYEPGKLQGVKTVTYTPGKDIIQFNEGDVSSHPYRTNEKVVDVTRHSSFLPTPTEPEDNGPAFIHYEKYTTPSEEIVSKLPQNHKYSGSRNRFHLGSYTTESPIQYISEHRQPTTTTQPSIRTTDDGYQQYEMSTRKTIGRRRKPSKNKTKDYTRQKVNVYTEQTPSIDVYSTADPVTEANYPSTKKKLHTKHTTSTEATEENYPNYPNYPNFANFPSVITTTLNYPKGYQYDKYTPSHTQNTADQYEPAHKQYTQEYQPPQTQYVSENRDTEEKENYPVFTPSTTTRIPETTAPPTAATALATSLRPRLKPKYGNSTRPRFSIKDYKRTTVSPQTTASPSSTENLPNFESEKKNNRKNLFALRLKNRTEPTSTEKEDSTTTELFRKYKPRTRPSKYAYKISTTTVAAETTSERVNSFKPSTTSRYRPTGTNKYINRIRTTTEIVTNDAEDAATAASDKKPVRTMLYSAKRSSILKPKTTTNHPKVEEYEDDEEDEYLENEAEESTSAATSPKKNFQKYKNTAASKLEKADDVAETSIMTSSEEESEKEKLKSIKSEASEDVAYVTGTSGSGLPSDAAATVAEDDSSYLDEILELHHDNEATTTAASSSTSKAPEAAAEERIDDDEGDRVSKVSSLTSIIDNSKLPASFYRKWSSTDNQKE